MKLMVSDIQHFSTGDGDGIRTTVFLQGCNLRCPWCHNPETQSLTPCLLHYRETGIERVSGTMLEISSIVRECMEDIDFYQQNGGVTISGGEPMLQADGVALLAMQLKQQNVSVIIDTAGDVPYSEFEKTNPVTDLYFYDFKTASALSCRDTVGGNYERILRNLSHLISEGKDVQIRIPLIEGFNTSDDDCGRICKVLNTVGVKKISLLPFHRLGSGKYKALSIPYSYENTEPLAKEQLQRIAAIYKSEFAEVSYDR